MKTMNVVLGFGIVLTFLMFSTLPAWPADVVVQLPPIQATAKSVTADLVTLGWIDAEAAEGATVEEFHKVCHEYCEFFGLKHAAATPFVDVADHMSRRRCTVGDFEGRELATWPVKCLSDLGLYWNWIRYRASQIGFSQAEAEEIVDRALAHWNSKIGVRLYRSFDFPTAVCNVEWKALGGSTLAWSNFPDGTCNDNKSQRYDSNRRWSKHQFFQTVLHEVGHLIGLSHHGSGVMKPTIDTRLHGLSDVDVSRAKTMGYGPPFDKPPPPPPTGLGVRGSVTLQNGTIVPASLLKSIDLIFGKPTNGGGVVILPPI